MFSSFVRILFCFSGHLWFNISEVHRLLTQNPPFLSGEHLLFTLCHLLV